MTKFTIDQRYNHIGMNFNMPVDQFDEIWNWCYNKPKQYDMFTTGVVYKTEQDLTEFLLRWS